MTDSVVESIVTLSLRNLSRLLVDEVNLGSNVKAKIKSLSKELEFMDVFLKNSEGKRNDDPVKVLVNQIRDVAHEVEDVVDTYVASVTLQRRRNICNKLLHCLGQEVMLHDVDAEVESIKRSIDEIYGNKDKYNIREGEFQSERDTEEEVATSLRERRKDVEEEEVVGLVHDSTIVIEKLKEINSRLNVVSIIGMGGLGKTTLARKIYNKDEVKGMFLCRAWGYVSNDYRARELLLSLLQCLRSSTSEYKDMIVEQLKEEVRECLKGKKYLVVLDDIWKTEVWDDLKGAFPDDRNGSRILVTSRMKEVASYSKATLAYDLPFLNEEVSWQLFTKKVFGEEECPCDLELMGKKMVKSCKGLPLAIVVLAGLVAKKDRSQREWCKIKDYVNWHLAQDKIVKDILKLSYDNLPRKLKPCFLYLGIYPEDREIRVRELIQLWIVEGFIQPKEIGTSNAPELEDVADNYLDELVDRSLVQVARRRTDGGVKKCRIHDLLRDLCISESKANKFMEVCTELDIDRCSPRRLSLHYKTKLLPTKYDQSHTRSLFLFGDEHGWDSKSNCWKWIGKSLKLARVLYFIPMWLTSQPRGLKTLIHLRYLKIQAYSDITRKIFASVCNLWNLETLYITLLGFGDDFNVPSGMCKMNRLRHIYFKGGIFYLSRAHISPMLNLQTLCGVAINPQRASALINDSFPNLTKLSLRIKMRKSSQQEQLRSLHRLNKLRTLKIHGDANSNLPLDANVFPSNLTKITLLFLYDLDSRFINTLGQLANLQILKLRNGSISGSVNCTAGGFPQLEVLHAVSFKVNGEWRQEKDAMPRLRHLSNGITQYRDEEARLKVQFIGSYDYTWAKFSREPA